MKLPALIFELLKAGFTIANTIDSDIKVTTLTRDTDNALARLYNTGSDSVFALALFPDRNLSLPIVIKTTPFPTHDQIDSILATFADRIQAARQSGLQYL